MAHQCDQQLQRSVLLPTIAITAMITVNYIQSLAIAPRLLLAASLAGIHRLYYAMVKLAK